MLLWLYNKTPKSVTIVIYCIQCYISDKSWMNANFFILIIMNLKLPLLNLHHFLEAALICGLNFSDNLQLSSSLFVKSLGVGY